jgi:hypothetical protein
MTVAIMDAHNQIRSFDNIIDLVWDVKSRHREVSFSWIPADVLKTAVEIVEQKSTENLEECLLAWREFFARRRFTGEEIGYCEIYSHKTNFYRGEFIWDQIIPDFDRLLRAGIVQWGGVINASVSQKKQVALYPIRLNSALVIPEGQAVVVTLKMTKNYRFESSAQADGWRFGVARVECGFGLNMIEGGSKYSTTAFTPFVTTPGFTQTCPYRPPHPMSITGGCYEWQDMPTCAWKTTDCSSASGGGASVTH